MDVCNGCYEGAAVLHGSGDGTVTFEPFPGTEHTTGRAVAEKKRGERREFDEEFWLRLVTDEDGALSKEKVLAELHDYSVLLDIVPKVYDEVTGGHASNPFTVPEVVCRLVEGRIERRAEEALARALEREAEGARREEGLPRTPRSVGEVRPGRPEAAPRLLLGERGRPGSDVRGGAQALPLRARFVREDSRLLAEVRAAPVGVPRQRRLESARKGAPDAAGGGEGGRPPPCN